MATKRPKRGFENFTTSQQGSIKAPGGGEVTWKRDLQETAVTVDRVEKDVAMLEQEAATHTAELDEAENELPTGATKKENPVANRTTKLTFKWAPTSGSDCLEGHLVYHRSFCGERSNRRGDLVVGGSQ